MDSSRLAARMLEWEQMKKQIDILEAEIKAAVLEIGKTQTVGNVRVTYSAGRRSFDYETPAMIAPKAIIDRNTETKLVINWKGVCEETGIEPYVSQGEPSATVKLL